MITLRLNAENASTRGDLHTAFAETFSFPEWYGRNLDALHDCLTEFSEDAEISMEEDSLLACLGDRYTEQLQRLLADVAEDNPHIRLVEIE